MKYTLAGELYTSKAAIERHYRGIVRGCPVGTVIDTGRDFDFLYAILRHHDRRSEKIGSGVAGFVVVEADRGSRGIWIRRTDGTDTDVSLLKTIQRMGMTPRQRARYDIQRVLRHEISSQIHAFREQATIEQQCHHVDHITPFAEILEAWLIARGLDYATIPIRYGERGADCELLDRNLAQNWQDSHRCHATLRMLSPEQHKRRPKAKVDWTRIERKTSSST